MSQSATVVATYSRRMAVQLPEGPVVDARIKGKKLKPVCGDRVSIEPIDNEDDWLITGIDERRNELTRPDTRGRIEVLAANVDLLVVVASVLPRPDWFIVDRYLCAAEIMRVEGAVVFNKTDLERSDGESATELRRYEQIGYATASTSVVSGVGIDDVRDLVNDRTAIIVGQSGVGKSSIINALLGHEQQKTSGISGKTREGRHTTVNSVMLELPGGGRVIDSPGVRDYAPVLDSIAAVERGFREIRDLGAGCQFHNCRHLQEPVCAVKQAVESNDVSERRYESYKRCLRKVL